MAKRTSGRRTGRASRDRARAAVRRQAPMVDAPAETAAPASVAPAAQQVEVTARPVTATRVAGSSLRRAATAPIAEDYSYVYHDLRRVAIITTAIVVILVALALYLN